MPSNLRVDRRSQHLHRDENNCIVKDLLSIFSFHYKLPGAIQYINTNLFPLLYDSTIYAVLYCFPIWCHAKHASIRYCNAIDGNHLQLERIAPYRPYNGLPILY